MRNKSLKKRCEKQMLPNFEGVCKTYDKLQTATAIYLSEQTDIKNIRCNVESFELDGKKYTSDFVYEKEDGEITVRECVFRNLLMKPLTVKLLDASRSFWLSRGITDWGIVIDEANE